MKLPQSVLAGACLGLAGAVSPVVEVQGGRYAGVENGNGVTQWLGMRYAAAPVGDLRFRRAVDAPWMSGGDGVVKADKHGPICLATATTATTAAPNGTYGGQSEDCLFLDVYAPSDASPDAKLPVFFFIQGGGFVANHDANYNGTGLVQAGNLSLIVVTFNYRVGAFGFLTDGDAFPPNNGLWDQVKALEWVQRHIAKFGGDPSHVVLGGDSAGAASISYHLTRGGGQDHGLFVAAAAESVPFSTVYTVAEARYLYDGFAIRAGCATARSTDCLLEKSTAELQAAHVNVLPQPGAQNPPLFAWSPVLDGDFITEVPYDAYRSGHFVRVPVLTGDDANGGTIFAPVKTSTTVQVNTFLRDQFPLLALSDLETIGGSYPNANPTCPAEGCRWRQLSDMLGDMRYTCPGLFVNRQYHAHGVPATWAYLWDVQDPAQVAAGYGVPHVAEVHAIFGPENTRGRAPRSYYPGGLNAGAVTVAQAYWASFIRALDPNVYRAEGAAEWKRAGGGDGQVRLVFGTGGETRVEGLPPRLDRACRFFAEIGSRIRQ